MNTCPVYRRSGGYSYTYFVPGPIGINLGMLKDAEKYRDNVSACSLCHSCQNVCPAKVDLADQIYKWRQYLNKHGLASSSKHAMSAAMETLMNHPSLFHFALHHASVANKLPYWLTYNQFNDWGKEHDMPVFASESFSDWWKHNQDKQKK